MDWLLIMGFRQNFLWSFKQKWTLNIRSEFLKVRFVEKQGCGVVSKVHFSLKDHKKFYLKPKIRSPSILEIILINSIPLVCLHNQLCLISNETRTCSVSVRHVPVPQIFTFDYSQMDVLLILGFRQNFLWSFKEKWTLIIRFLDQIFVSDFWVEISGRPNCSFAFLHYYAKLSMCLFTSQSLFPFRCLHKEDLGKKMLLTRTLIICSNS